MTWQGWWQPAAQRSALAVETDRDRLTRGPQNQPAARHINASHSPTRRQQLGAASSDIASAQGARLTAELDQRLGPAATANHPAEAESRRQTRRTRAARPRCGHDRQKRIRPSDRLSCHHLLRAWQRRETCGLGLLSSLPRFNLAWLEGRNRFDCARLRIRTALTSAQQQRERQGQRRCRFQPGRGNGQGWLAVLWSPSPPAWSVPSTAQGLRATHSSRSA